MTTNPAWKRNRNTYADILLEMVYNTNLEPPFNKIPPDGALPVINRANVQATQFVFVHKKRDAEWNGRRSSTPKRHTVSFHDLPRGETLRVSATPRGTKLGDPVERPRTAADVRPDPPKAAAISPPSTSISEVDSLRARLEASHRSEQQLRAEVQVVSRKTYMRTIAEQKQTIDELRAEIARLKRHDEAVKPAARYLSYNDVFEREVLEQPFQRHTKPAEKPRLLQTDLESLE